MKNTCRRLHVGKDICSILFPTQRKMGTHDAITTYYTVRGEWMIMHLDKKGRVFKIELLQSRMKPCQRTTS